MTLRDLNVELKHVPSLDQGFMPLKPYKDAYIKSVKENGGEPIAIGIERNNGQCSVYEFETHINPKYRGMDNNFVERFVKFLLWMKGGYKVYICGNPEIGDHIKNVYTDKGERAFDVTFMERVYEHNFEVVIGDFSDRPKENEVGQPVGGGLDGCRIGFDAGGSDMKVCAVKDGEVLYAEEVVWLPKLNDDPNYHYEHIQSCIEKAATFLPQVDAIGISSAGVYVDNRCMVASLFILIEGEVFDQRIKDIFLNVTKAYPEAKVRVLNDGDVAAVAGAMNIGTNSVMGIAMGTSEAVGFVDKEGKIKGWLNELAFAPVDYNPEAMEDEWSGDYGCGCKYFSQDSVIKLAERAEIELDSNLTLAEKLKVVQKLMTEQDSRAKEVYENIGIYLGHTLAYYYELYEMNNLLLLGRVMSGDGGNIILDFAQKVLAEEYPEINNDLSLSLPDEKARRVGQSVAAASIPSLS